MKHCRTKWVSVSIITLNCLFISGAVFGSEDSNTPTVVDAPSLSEGAMSKLVLQRTPNGDLEVRINKEVPRARIFGSTILPHPVVLIDDKFDPYLQNTRSEIRKSILGHPILFDESAGFHFLNDGYLQYSDGLAGIVAEPQGIVEEHKNELLPLNKEQETLYKRISTEIDDYIQFMEPNEYKHYPNEYEDLGISSENSVKPWTESEKQFIRRVFVDILHLAPGLMLSATAGQKIPLCRVPRLRDVSPGHSGILVTFDQIIFVPNRFFDNNFPLRYMVYELLHLADCANRFSYSKEWIQFANPIITKVRKRQAETTNESQLDQSIRQHNIWPHLASCANLEEAFAGYFTEYIVHTKFQVDPKIVGQFSNHLLSPSTEEKNFPEHFVRGTKALQSRDLASARAEFLNASSVDPMNGVTYCYLTWTNDQQDWKTNLTYCTKACRIFSQAGVPLNEYWYSYARKGHDGFLRNLNKYKKQRTNDTRSKKAIDD
jgi:hypothetical protein